MEAVKRGTGEALSWYKKSAENGYIIAQRVLGHHCYNFQDDCHSLESFKWTKKAAEQGEHQAQYYMGLSYFNGKALDEDGVVKDKEEALKWFSLSLKGKGYWLSKAYLYLGEIYSDKKLMVYNSKKAIENYEIAAKLGERVALEELANCYFRGKFVQQDYNKAFTLYEALFKKYRNALTMYRLAFLYENGYGTDVQDKKVIWLYDYAGWKGNVQAQVRLGKIYEYGELGAQKSRSQACYWYKRAAKTSKVAQKALQRLNYQITDFISRY